MMVESPNPQTKNNFDITDSQKELTFNQFIDIFRDKIYYRNALPDFFGDLCRGWTQETFRQIYMTMTKRGSVPLKFWYESEVEMRNISNKRQACKELFEWVDFKKLNRICSLEVFATIIFSLEGTTEIVGQNIMLFFGFQSETEFYRGELHFFFDCLFRGLCNLTVRKEDS